VASKSSGLHQVGNWLVSGFGFSSFIIHPWVQPWRAPGVEQVTICRYGTYAVDSGSSLLSVEGVEQRLLPFIPP
jgi:hypothetical protein